MDGEAGTYKVQCESAGSIGNQYFGPMVPIEYIRGLQSAELTQVLIPGEDEESTSSGQKMPFNTAFVAGRG